MAKDKFTLDLQRGFLETAIDDCKRVMGQLEMPLQTPLYEWYKGRLSVWEMLLDWHKKEHDND